MSHKKPSNLTFFLFIAIAALLIGSTWGCDSWKPPSAQENAEALAMVLPTDLPVPAQVPICEALISGPTYLGGKKVQVFDSSKNCDQDASSWNWGDGATDSGKDPQHTYAECQDYTIRLFADGPNYTDELGDAQTNSSTKTANVQYLLFGDCS